MAVILVIVIFPRNITDKRNVIYKYNDVRTMITNMEFSQKTNTKNIMNIWQ